MGAPSLATVKRLFARSGNRCAFPECDVPLVEESGTVTGEICHIRAASPGGPRYHEAQTDDARNAAANLILLCGRHHKLVDAEPNKFTVQTLSEFKSRRESAGTVEISPISAKAAAGLLARYATPVIRANGSQIAINSPGAVQAGTIHVRTTKTKITIAAPPGSIGADRVMTSYATYLIGRYQEFQKADKTKTGRYKYMAVFAALKRHFKGDWKLLPASRFPEVVQFLERRIDDTIVGRVTKASGRPLYHRFDEHV